jgi:hypothetical protein
MVCVPVPNAVGVYETEQMAVAPLPLRVQLPELLNVPLSLLVKLSLPLGVTVVPESLSVTEAVQVVALFTLTEAGKQLTEAEVVRLLTVKPFVKVPVALPPPEPGLVTETLRAPIAAPEPIVMFATICVLLLTVVVFTVMFEPKLTVLFATKFVPEMVTFSVVFRSPEVGETLVTVGAVAVVE